MEVGSGSRSNAWLRRIARASAWALFLAIVVLVLSGWGITQTGPIYRVTFGLVDRRLADSIHRATIAPSAFLFLLHTLVNARLSLTAKHPSRVWPVSVGMVIIGGGILALVVYMQYFRPGG